MNVFWQGNAPSFLDGSSRGGAGAFAPSFGDGGAPWFGSADGGLFSSQPVLWWDNGADSPPAASSLTGVPGFDPGGAAGGWLPNGAEAFTGVNPALDGGLLWHESGGSASSSLLVNGGAGQFDLTAGSGGLPQWQQIVDEFASHSWTWITEASNLLWTGGQSPMTPPITGNSPQLTGDVPIFATLASGQLVWTDASHAASSLLDTQPLTGVVPPNLLVSPPPSSLDTQQLTGIIPAHLLVSSP